MSTPRRAPHADQAVTFEVWVKPRAARSRVLGLRDGAVHVAVAAVPVDGAANEALLRLLADTLGVRRSALEIRAGASSRKKSIRVTGLDAATLEARWPAH